MTIEIACLDPNPHELLVHEVASRTGAYERHGVDVEVVDRPGAAGLASPLTFGLGGSLLQRARTGTPWVVASVNTDRPLFWLVARSPDVASDLRGRRLVGWPEHVPPTLMLRAALRDAGADADGLETDVVAPGPGADRQRLDALLSGTADLALLGSQLPPSVVEDLATPLMWVGAHVRIPTTGIAVNVGGRSRHDPDVVGVVRAQREALRLVINGDDDDVVLASLATLFSEGAEADHRHFLDRFVKTSFGPIANVETRRQWERAAHDLCRSAGVAHPNVSDFYRDIDQG